MFYVECLLQLRIDRTGNLIKSDCHTQVEKNCLEEQQSTSYVRIYVYSVGE